MNIKCSIPNLTKRLGWPPCVNLGTAYCNRCVYNKNNVLSLKRYREDNYQDNMGKTTTAISKMLNVIG